MAFLILALAPFPVVAQPDEPAQSSNIRPLPSASAASAMATVTELNNGKSKGYPTNAAVTNFQAADIHRVDIHAPDIHAADIHTIGDTNSVPDIQSADVIKK